MRAIDAEANAALFAIALDGQWAKHDKENEDVYDVCGQEVTFVFREDVERKI